MKLVWSIRLVSFNFFTIHLMVIIKNELFLQFLKLTYILGWPSSPFISS